MHAKPSALRAFSIAGQSLDKLTQFQFDNNKSVKSGKFNGDDQNKPKVNPLLAYSTNNS